MLISRDGIHFKADRHRDEYLPWTIHNAPTAATAKSGDMEVRGSGRMVVQKSLSARWKDGWLQCNL